MQTNYVSRSSSKGRLWAHIVYKVKYCHRIFDFYDIKTRCEQIFLAVAENNQLEISQIGFGSHHVHMDIDLGIKSVPEVAKLLKGTSGRKLLEEFPWLKKKYFWGSGLWNPGTFFDSVGRDKEQIDKYIANQDKSKSQFRLTNFINSTSL